MLQHVLILNTTVNDNGTEGKHWQGYVTTGGEEWML
jgi:hypothetical protein